ncbi:hypothetical protein CEB3_c50210 [Peptococcaceae bacterium CEB3]|nr:hypothetical protein CEB3_c50210 [Peptococcaceae bacterium CEB3]
MANPILLIQKDGISGAVRQELAALKPGKAAHYLQKRVPEEITIFGGEAFILQNHGFYFSSRKSTTFFILIPSYEFTKLLSMESTIFS